MSQFTTYQALKEAVNKAAQDIAQLGYPELLTNRFVVGTSERITLHAGVCEKKKGFYILSFNLPYMRLVTDEEALSTIYHEVAHAIKDGMSHTGKWKACAQKITKQLGVPVQRVNHHDEYSKLYKQAHSTENKTTYQPICNECGFEMRSYKSQCTPIKSIMRGERRFFCPGCKSRNLYVRINKPKT